MNDGNEVRIESSSLTTLRTALEHLPSRAIVLVPTDEFDETIRIADEIERFDLIIKRCTTPDTN